MNVDPSVEICHAAASGKFMFTFAIAVLALLVKKFNPVIDTLVAMFAVVAVSAVDNSNAMVSDWHAPISATFAAIAVSCDPEKLTRDVAVTLDAKYRFAPFGAAGALALIVTPVPVTVSVPTLPEKWTLFATLVVIVAWLRCSVAVCTIGPWIRMLWLWLVSTDVAPVTLIVIESVAAVLGFTTMFPSGVPVTVSDDPSTVTSTRPAATVLWMFASGDVIVVPDSTRTNADVVPISRDPRRHTLHDAVVRRVAPLNVICGAAFPLNTKFPLCAVKSPLIVNGLVTSSVLPKNALLLDAVRDDPVPTLIVTDTALSGICRFEPPLAVS